MSVEQSALLLLLEMLAPPLREEGNFKETLDSVIFLTEDQCDSAVFLTVSELLMHPNIKICSFYRMSSGVTIKQRSFPDFTEKSDIIKQPDFL